MDSILKEPTTESLPNEWCESHFPIQLTLIALLWNQIFNHSVCLNQRGESCELMNVGSVMSRQASSTLVLKKCVQHCVNTFIVSFTGLGLDQYKKYDPKVSADKFRGISESFGIFLILKSNLSVLLSLQWCTRLDHQSESFHLQYLLWSLNPRPELNFDFAFLAQHLEPNGMDFVIFLPLSWIFKPSARVPVQWTVPS